MLSSALYCGAQNLRKFGNILVLRAGCRKVYNTFSGLLAFDNERRSLDFPMTATVHCMQPTFIDSSERVKVRTHHRLMERRYVGSAKWLLRPSQCSSSAKPQPVDSIWLSGAATSGVNRQIRSKAKKLYTLQFRIDSGSTIKRMRTVRGGSKHQRINDHSW